MHTGLRHFAFASLLITSGVFVGACTDAAEEAEPLCTPGSNVFCRCRGGARSGTKTCLDGSSFGACETPGGTCSEDPSGGSGGGATKPPGGGGEPPPPPGELLAACTDDAECSTGHCAMGFCTKGCDSFEQCTPPEPAAPGDCVTVPGTSLDDQPGVCVPYCITQENCEAYGPNSRCSYTDESFPAFDVVVCADWEQVQLPPDGYPSNFDCDDDLYCNLGLLGVERICSLDGCTDGCNVDDDCPTGVSCGDGGSCGGEPPASGDACPGEAVTLGLGDSEARSGDTSSLTDTQAPVLGCLNEAPTSEEVWAVTVQDSGNLIVLVEPSATFDPILYGRRGCSDGADGAQVVCSDDEFDGGGEIAEVLVTAGETIHIFVEGYTGSTGSYDITFDLGSP